MKRKPSLARIILESALFSFLIHTLFFIGMFLIALYMSKNYKPSVMNNYDTFLPLQSQTVQNITWIGFPLEIIPSFLIVMAGYIGLRFLLLKKKRSN